MQDSDELAIRKLVSTWLDATRAGDVDAVLALMAPDAVFLVPGGAPLCGRDAFAGSLRALLGTHSIEPLSDIQEIAVDGSLAYCRTKLTVEVKPKDGSTAPVRRSGHTLSIMRRQPDGSWLLTVDANLLGAPA
jgi:uncharacterized protein (TIGR02246 family)